jgi:hypothetical protein
VPTLTAPNQIREAKSRAQTREYSAFGGILRSEIEFPELTAVAPSSRPDWTVSIDSSDRSLPTLTLVGERVVGEEVYRLFSFAGGWRLTYSHAGTFDISSDGAAIIWHHDDAARPELVRSIILGPVISLALELTGFFCLHGSAVVIAETAIAFVGPKHFGKSTLATALTTAGAKLIGDDLLVVRPGAPAMVRPGIGSVRLWPDMAAVLPLAGVCNTLIPGIKATATGFVDEALATMATPLRAIYVLSPVLDTPSGPVAWRKLLSPIEAAMALALQTKLPASLVGLHGAGAQLAAAAAVAATVPVWTLHAIRDVSRMAELVRQVTEWSRVE